MYLFGKHTNNLKPADISRLLDNQIKENKELDYKRELNIDDGKDKNKQEFLCDIASMYNTDGGCIIYGIEEKKDASKKNTGYPGSLYTQTIDNIDTLTQKLYDIIKSGTQPAIVNIAFRLLEIDNAKVFIIGIAKGFGLPAMVTYNDINKFYRRNTTGKYAMDVYELNQAFMQNQSVAENAEQLKKTRVDGVMNNTVYPNIDRKGAFFVHAIPVEYQRNTFINLSKLKDAEIEDSIQPVRSHFRHNKSVRDTDSAFNFDGFMRYRTYGTDDKIFAYNQFFRNGIIEFYSNEYYVDKASNSISEDYLFGSPLIWAIIEALHKTRDIWTHLEINPPFFVFITLLVPPASLAGVNNFYDGHLPRGNFELPFVYFEKFPETHGEIYAHIKQHLDIIWQTAGKDGCPDQEQFFSQRL